MEAEAAMASSSSSETEEETAPLAGGVQPPPPPDTKEDLQAAVAAARRNFLELTETITRLGLQPPPERWFSPFARLWRRFYLRVHPDPYSIHPSNHILEIGEEIEILQQPRLPNVCKVLAKDRQLMKDCLDHYNRLHPDNEYEPILGNASRHPHLHDGSCWTHGNFLARKKGSGFLSFLTAPRAVFFYELSYMDGSNRIVTCTPVEEPAYITLLGFPLWWARLRSGKLDTYCKTCNCRFGIPRPGIQKLFDCGHNNVTEVCEMCYVRCDTLHPNPGEFAFGYHHPYRPYPTRH